jgi:hypothetical protein
MTSAQAVSIDSVAQTLPGPRQPRDLEMHAPGLSTRDTGDAFRGPDGELLLSRSAVSEITDRRGRTTRGSAPGPEPEPGAKVPGRYLGHLGLGRPSGGGRESRVLERSEPPAHAGANAVSPDTKLHVAQNKVGPVPNATGSADIADLNRRRIRRDLSSHSAERSAHRTPEP